jgi:hypothetical protein
VQLAARPYLTAGVALVGASVIAASSVTPLPDIHLPDVHLPAISTAKVNLTDVENPLAEYVQVIQNALAAVSTLASDAHPGQVLEAILANQLGSASGIGAAVQTAGGDIAQVLTAQVPALVQTALADIAAGNVAGAVNTLVTAPLSVAFPLAGLVPALAPLLTNPVQNLSKVITAFTGPDFLNTELIAAGFLAPLVSTPVAVAAAVQNVINAATTANPAGIVGALLTAPATIADGVLNGNIGPDLSSLLPGGGFGVPILAGGLFSTSAFLQNAAGFFISTGGPLYAIEEVFNTITGPLAPAATAAVKPVTTSPAGIPAATTAATITLKTGSSAVAIPAKATTASSTADAATAVKSSTDTTSDPAKSADPASTTTDSTPKSDPTKSGDKSGTAKGSHQGAHDGTGKDSHEGGHDGGGAGRGSHHGSGGHSSK